MAKLNPEPETIFQEAIDFWWNSKKTNHKRIQKSQGGSRNENLRGDTMDGFRDAIVKALIDLGVRKSDLFFGNSFSARASNLPAYFRATKNWDIIVCKNARIDRAGEFEMEAPSLIAAIEFKSQTGSTGNNQNNRIEESIGNAVDFWAAYEHGTLGPLLPRPWLGYLFVGRYPEGAEEQSVQINHPLIQVDKSFQKENPASTGSSFRVSGISYAERYKVFLERMIGKKLYDGASFLTTDEDLRAATPNYRVLYPSLSGTAFLDGLIRHVKAHYFN